VPKALILCVNQNFGHITVIGDVASARQQAWTESSVGHNFDYQEILAKVRDCLPLTFRSSCHFFALNDRMIHVLDVPSRMIT